MGDKHLRAWLAKFRYALCLQRTPPLTPIYNSDTLKTYIKLLWITLWIILSKHFFKWFKTAGRKALTPINLSYEFIHPTTVVIQSFLIFFHIVLQSFTVVFNFSMHHYHHHH